MATAARPALLERERELGELLAAARDAERGRGRLVVIEGPAGIGKTRLLREARERAARAGMRVLAARASELERDFPFAVVRQLLEPALAAADDGARRELLGAAAAPAAAVVGPSPDVTAGDQAADPSFATLNGLYWLVSNLSEAVPTLVAVDDGHWCDQASLRFLSFLAPRLEDLPVLLVVATRPAADDAALARLATDPAARLLRPRTLSAAAVAELVHAAFAGAASDEYCAAVEHVTGGNPFLVHELLAQLAAEGGSGASEEAAHVRDVVPATIAHAVLVRLARAPESARRLVRALAVLGDGAEVRLAAALAELPRDAAADAADALVAAGVLEPGRPLRFLHPLLRAAVYDDTPAAWRAARHARAADLLRAEGAEPERIAVHLVATDPGDAEAVVETLRRAARRALDRAAPESAVAYLKRALREGRGDRDELARMLVTAGLRATDPAAFEGIGFDLVAEMLADPPASTAVAAELGIWLYGGGRRREGARLLEQAAAAAARSGDHDLAMRLAAQRIASDQLRLSKARKEMAAYGARVRPGSSGERLFLAMEAYAASLGGEPGAVDVARRGLDGGRIFREQPGSPAPYGALWVLLFADELDEAGRVIEFALHDARERRALIGITLGTAFRGRLAQARGDVAGAEADLRSAAELIRVHTADVRALPTVLAWLLDALVERGEPAAAERELAAVGLGAEIPPAPWLNDVLFQRGRARLAVGRLDDGLADLLEAGRRDQAADRSNPAAMPWASAAAPALAARGRGDDARELVADELDRARRWGAARPIANALRVSGLLEGGDAGLERLREAVALLEDSPARLEHARALADLGAALRRANRRADAREPLRRALDLARHGGALAVARRAHEELAATGERLRPLAAAGADSLTPSERRIAELAAAGQSNREIAQALFLTVKTVETHLSNAYRKLDIRSRRELAPALAGSRS